MSEADNLEEDARYLFKTIIPKLSVLSSLSEEEKTEEYLVVKSLLRKAKTVIRMYDIAYQREKLKQGEATYVELNIEYERLKKEIYGWSNTTSFIKTEEVVVPPPIAQPPPKTFKYWCCWK